VVDRIVNVPAAHWYAPPMRILRTSLKVFVHDFGGKRMGVTSN